MRKRAWSILLTLAMCLSLLPQAALAEDLDAGQPVQASIEEGEPQPIGDEGNGGGEDAAVLSVQAMIDALPEEINADDADIADALAAIEGEMAALSEDQRAALDVSRYEAALAALEGQADETEQDAAESENADTDDTEQETASDENYALSETGGGTTEVDKLPSPVQAMIDALPDELTEENAGDVSAKLGEIDAAMAALEDEERAALDLTQYQAAIAALAALAAAQGEIALYADDTNKPAKGDGTEENPYQITTTDELEWFRDTVNAGGTEICAELMNNLNFGDVTWTPIGNGADRAYTGTFNGNGYRIMMKYANAPSDMTKGWGLFGSIGNGGKVQDLDVYFSNFEWNGNTFSISESGMLAAYNSGTIERCTATNGEINVSKGVGLLVYQNDGMIQDCLTKLGTVIGGGESIGGVAYINNGNIKNCFFNGGYKKNYLDGHTIAFEKGTSGNIENCYFISDCNYTDSTKGVTGVAQADANTGKLTVMLNNEGDAKGSKVDPWRIGSTAPILPSLKKTDSRVSYDSVNNKYVPSEQPHMHGNVEFTKVTALGDIIADGNYYISGDITLSDTWQVKNNVVLCLDGQTITAASGVATAIEIESGGSLTLVDGSKNGGGKITGGATGVTLNGGAFTMQGGEISGSTVGVHVQSGDLTLGGKAQVTGNDKNILLAANQKIHFDSLDSSAKFGISVEGQESWDDVNKRVAVTDETGGQYFAQLVADGFEDDGSGFELYLDGNIVMLGRQSEHKHCICGDNSKEVNGHTHGADITFQPWTKTDSLPTSGNYYLTRNVTLSGNAVAKGDLNLCLNGYTVTLSDVGRINPSGTTQLTDCSVDGKLESFSGKANGGVTISGGSEFCLYGGTLNGVKVEISQTGGGTFNMYGGRITGNKASTVVGQSKTSGGSSSTITINMYGGKIDHNDVTDQAGGVFVGAGRQFNMYGGTISNNSATDSGGVYVAPANSVSAAGTMTICGDAVIQGNIRSNEAGNSTNNVYLPSGSTIKIDGRMDASAQIGVTTASTPPVNIATTADADWVAAKNFTSDNSAYHVGLVNDGKTVQLQVHSHQWEYSVSQDGTTITAKCMAENCDLTGGNGGSVQIVPPSGSPLIYDGTEKTATVQGPDWKASPEVDQINISYTKDGDNTFTGNPKDAGTYTASITVGGETAKVEYTIEKKSISISGATATDRAYEAGKMEVEISGVAFDGLVSGENLKKGTDYTVSGEMGNADVGTAKKVTVTVTLIGDAAKNYDLGNNGTTTTTATISKIAYTGSTAASGEARYGASGTVDLTNYIAEGGKASYVSHTDTDGILAEAPSVSDHTLHFKFKSDAKKNQTAEIKVEVANATNYDDYEITVTVTVLDKEAQSITASDITASYGDTNVKVTPSGAIGTVSYEVIEGDDVVAVDASGVVTIQKAGKAKIKISAAGDATHAEGTAEVNVTINKREISVKADDKTMTVGGTMPTLTVTYGNFANGDTKDTVLETQPIPTTTADGKTVGAFDITVEKPTLKSGMDANYTVGEPQKGTLTVNAAGNGGNTGGSSGGGSSSSRSNITVDNGKNGDTSVSPKSASKGDTVTIRVEPKEGFELDDICVVDQNGNTVPITDQGDGKYSFIMPAGKVKVETSFTEATASEPTEPSNPTEPTKPGRLFDDVSEDAYYYEAVKWAQENGITSGIGKGLFGPKQPCTRAQIVTFLWRAAGSPEPKGGSGFSDVPADSYYAKAVAWAVENGITGGTGNGKFSPHMTCTRAQAVAFLYRAAGSPEVEGNAAFRDVKQDGYYALAVAWAALNDITGGIGEGLFGPEGDCTRAQIVTFLYRMYAGE